VDGRFMTGIKPQEFFFHCMAGREVGMKCLWCLQFQCNVHTTPVLWFCYCIDG
jgi:hypothetical protein